MAVITLLLTLKKCKLFSLKKIVIMHLNFYSFLSLTQKKRHLLKLGNFDNKQAAIDLMYKLLFPYCIFQTTCELVLDKDLVYEAGNPGTLYC